MGFVGGNSGGDELLKKIESVEGEIKVERSRINQLTALSEGSTTGDAELVDIRVGSDGTEYLTAGEAVRSQNKRVLDMINNTIRFENKSVSTTGVISTSTKYLLSNFISVANFIKAGTTINGNYYLTVVLYDKNFTFIQKLSTWFYAFTRIQLTEDTAFIRILLRNKSTTDIAPTDDTGFYIDTVNSTIINANTDIYGNVYNTIGDRIGQGEYINRYLKALLAYSPEFEQGTISSTNGVSGAASTNRIRTDYISVPIVDVGVGEEFKFALFQYDTNKSYISFTGFVTSLSPDVIVDNCKYVRFVVCRADSGNLTPESDTGFYLYTADTTIKEIESSIKGSGSDEKVTGDIHPNLNVDIMNIAYSNIGVAPTNTAEHYLAACHLGFNAIKGDVRITADNQLIMCHDAGFTIKENGKIGTYNEANSINILEYDYETLMSLEYDGYYSTMGHYAKVCDFDTYIRICKEHGKIAYITLRKDNIEILITKVLETLKKYNMTDRCVINSFDLITLQELRKHNDTILLSNVRSFGAVLTPSIVNVVADLGNAVVTLFFYSVTSDDATSLWEQSKDAIQYARDKGIQIHTGQVGSFAEYSKLVQMGIQGFQITKPFLEYHRSDIHFRVTISNGIATFENVFGSDRYTADVTHTDGNVVIANISTSAGYGFDDGLPMTWLNLFPKTITVSCDTNPNAEITFENKVLTLKTDNIDGIYNIHVNI